MSKLPYAHPAGVRVGRVGDCAVDRVVGFEVDQVLGVHLDRRHPHTVHERPGVPAVVRGRAEFEAAVAEFAQAVEPVATVRHDVDR